MSIAPYQQNGAAVAVPTEQPPQVSAVAALVEWAHGAQAAHEVAVNLVETSFCPQHYRGKPHEATAAILAGLEVGLQPMAALQAFNPIQGSAAPKAITLRAIVQSHGHHVEIVESSATRAVAVGRRKGSTVEQRSEWTIERAEQMKLLGNANWQKQPTAMLIARATSEICRLVAADAILGIPYSYEELADGAGPVQATAEQVTPPPSAAAARRRNPSRVIPEAAAVEASPEPVETPGSTRLDPKGEVLAQLLGLLGQRFAERGDAVAFVAETVGRPVAHPKDLTHAEARRVIDRLSVQDDTAAPVDGEGGGS